MNYAGKFDAALSLDGQGSHSPAYVPVDSFTAKGHGHVPAGAFVVPDPNLVFHGDFSRAGVDLVLSKDSEQFVVHDYFKGEKRAAIASPDGAHLTGDIVNALVGHVEYAQAAPGAAVADVIGHVTKLTGSATVIRNGVSIILNNGDNVEKGDVVSTGSDSTLGITFIDGTVFGLSANARMVLNEMVYDPNGSNNSSLLSLVAGTITFVAGETAKHGEMRVDTPVATMGIRGTAVVTEISFIIPPATPTNPNPEPQPQANFQVLVEPDGHTGSYILFDKTTLLPIATVNQAGQMVQISGGNVSVTNALLSPEVQKLITDVFTLKFTDNSTNTKLTTNFTDTITPDSTGFLIKTANGTIADVKVVNTVTNAGGQTQDNSDDSSVYSRVPGPPEARVLDPNGHVTTTFAVTELAGQTGDAGDADIVIFRVNFADFNQGDRPLVDVRLPDAPNYTYQDASHHDVTASLTDLQKQDIAATQIKITVVADPNNNNNGTALATYSIADNAFDFLAEGEKLTLTYLVRVDNNFPTDREVTTIPITITITGTNDAPVITSSVPTITFAGGTSVPGGPLTSSVPTSGTLTFTDVDLTDTHAVKVELTDASLPGGSVPPGPLAIFAEAMSVQLEQDSTETGNNTGTIDWSLADLPVYVADFIPKGETLTLTYTVTLTDSQGATSTQTITVAIQGTDNAAVVWIATTEAGSPPGGFWKDAANWETGTVPTIDDDVIVITDQLHGLTPSYPVTIDEAAFANSLTMDDFGGPPPELVNDSTLTIAGVLGLFADSKFTNSLGAQVSVGGAVDIEGTSKVTNAGTLTLAAGGKIITATTLTNSGLVDLSGGTLTLTSNISNAGGAFQVDPGATLDVTSATVDGGTVTIAGALVLEGTSVLKNGELDNSGSVTVTGTVAFDNETVVNDTTIEIQADATLTLDQNTTVDNSSGTITVDDGGMLVLNGAGISGGTINNFSSTLGGTIDVTGNSSIDGGAALNDGALTVETDVALTLDTVTVSGTTITDEGRIILDHTVTLQGGATIQGESIDARGAITNDGQLEISGPATLLNDVVTNHGTAKVDGGKTLTVSGTEISGGSINGAGTIDVTGDSTIDTGATLSTSAVTVEDGVALTLDGIAVSGSTISDGGSLVLKHTVRLEGNATIQDGPVINNNTLEIAGPATLLNDIVTNNGTVQVDVDQTLTLSGAEISGGIITGAGTIDVTGDSTIDTGAMLSVSTVTVENGIMLTLDPMTVSSTTLTVEGSLVLDDVTLEGGATIQGVSTAARGAVANNGTLEIAGLAALLNDIVTNNGTVQVDSNQTLTLSGTEISGGSINGAGTIDVTGASSIDTGATLSTSAVTVEDGVALTLDGIAVSGSTISDGGSLVLKHTVRLEGNATIQDGPVINNNTLEIAGPATLLNDIVTNNGTVQVDVDQTLTLSGTEISGGIITGAGTIDVTGDSTIDTGATLSVSAVTVENGIMLTLDPMTVSSTTLTVEGSLVLDDVTLEGGATIQGASPLAPGAVTNTGTLDIAGAATLLNDVVTNDGTVTVESTQTLTLSGVTISGGHIDGPGTIDVAGNTLIQGTKHNNKVVNATVSNGIIAIESGMTLELDNVTVTGVAFIDSASGALLSVDASDTLVLQGGASVTGSTDGMAVNFSNAGLVEIAGAAIFTNGIIANVSATIKIDAGEVLTLSHTTINGGMILDNGNIDIKGSSAIDGAIIKGGIITVEADQTLTLGTAQSGDTITGVTLAGSHATINIYGAFTDAIISGSHDTVEASGVGDKFSVTGDNDTLSISGAMATVNVSGDNDSVHINGSNGLVNLTGSNHSLTVFASYDTINVSGSSDALTVVGSGNTVNFSADNAKLTVSASSSTIMLTGDHETVVALGQNDNFIFASTDNDHDHDVDATLQFTSGSVGKATVFGFSVSDDLLVFDHTIFSSAAAVLNATKDVNGSAVITLDNHGDTITLVGIHTSHLTTSDFHIV